MMRLTWVLAVAVSWALPAGAGVAEAEPAAPPSCDYTLTAPHVVNVSGTDMVTATMSPAACNRSIVYQSVACLQVQGSDGPGRCAQNNGILVAQVYLAPYRPGATYTSTGRGCASTGNPPEPVCTTEGPFTATL